MDFRSARSCPACYLRYTPYWYSPSKVYESREQRWQNEKIDGVMYVYDVCHSTTKDKDLSRLGDGRENVQRASTTNTSSPSYSITANVRTTWPVISTAYSACKTRGRTPMAARTNEAYIAERTLFFFCFFFSSSSPFAAPVYASDRYWPHCASQMTVDDRRYISLVV